MPERQNAMVDQVAGNLKEFAGNVGNVIPGVDGESLIREGQEQKTSGDAEYKGAKSQDAANSAKDSVKGHLKSDIGGIFSEDARKDGEADKEKASIEKEASKH